jgi:hypothetical protein
MDTSLRLLALPLMLLVEEVCGNTRVHIAGDNQSMLLILKIGRNPTMGHLSRTHRASVVWRQEKHVRENSAVDYVSTDTMTADIFKKSTRAPAKWCEARSLINVFSNMEELMPCLPHGQVASRVSAAACLCS